MAKPIPYEILQGTISVAPGKSAGPGEILTLSPEDASSLVAAGLIIAVDDKPRRKTADPVALQARVTELEGQLASALSASPSAAAVKAAQDAQAEAERLLAAAKDAHALTDADLTKAQAELAEARTDLAKAAEDYAELLGDREADEAVLTALGFTRNEAGELVAPVPAEPAT